MRKEQVGRLGRRCWEKEAEDGATRQEAEGRFVMWRQKKKQSVSFSTGVCLFVCCLSAGTAAEGSLCPSFKH